MMKNTIVGVALLLGCLPAVSGAVVEQPVAPTVQSATTAEQPAAGVNQLATVGKPCPVHGRRTETSDIGLFFFPAKRHYLVQNLTSGIMTAGKKEMQDKYPIAVFINNIRSTGDRFVNRYFWSWGICFIDLDYDRTVERINPTGLNTPNDTNTGDRIQDSLVNIPLTFGAGQAMALGPVEAMLGLRAGFWPIFMQTITTDTRWAGATAVKVVSRDSRLLMSSSVSLDLEISVVRSKWMNLGIVGRGGYLGPITLGDDPNPDIAAVGMTPGELSPQIEIGGWFWYVGLKLF